MAQPDCFHCPAAASRTHLREGLHLRAQAPRQAAARLLGDLHHVPQAQRQRVPEAQAPQLRQHVLRALLGARGRRQGWRWLGQSGTAGTPCSCAKSRTQGAAQNRPSHSTPAHLCAGHAWRPREAAAGGRAVVGCRGGGHARGGARQAVSAGGRRGKLVRQQQAGVGLARGPAHRRLHQRLRRAASLLRLDRGCCLNGRPCQAQPRDRHLRPGSGADAPRGRCSRLDLHARQRGGDGLLQAWTAGRPASGVAGSVRTGTQQSHGQLACSTLVAPRPACPELGSQPKTRPPARPPGSAGPGRRGRPGRRRRTAGTARRTAPAAPAAAARPAGARDGRRGLPLAGASGALRCRAGSERGKSWAGQQGV